MCGWGTCKSFTTYLKSGNLHTDLQMRNGNFIWKCAIILARERFATKIDMIHKGRYSRALIIIQGSFYYVQEDEDFAR